MMRKLLILVLLPIVCVFAGCSFENNFMDVDNKNAKEDLKKLIGSGNIPNINVKDMIPDSLSGTYDKAKGYANKYYENALEEYGDKAKDGINEVTETLKGYYNDGVDELHGVISDKINGVISGELNKLKLK